MNELFSFSQKESVSTNNKLDAKASKKLARQKMRDSKRDDNFENIINPLGGFPNEKEYFAIKTNGTSDCGSIFSYALKEWKTIEEMYMATWTISKSNIRRIKESLESGKLKKLVLVFSSTLKPANPALYSSLVSELNIFDNVFLKEINSHAKTFSITNGEDFITVSGSANWSMNPRIENFLILNDKDLFEHHKHWMSEFTSLE